MGEKRHCDEHLDVDAAEMRWYAGVEVHMVVPWHTARKARHILMDGAQPVLDTGGNVVFAGSPFETAADAAPDTVGDDG